MNTPEKDTLEDIAFRITAYRHGSMDDKDFKESVLSILKGWERERRGRGE